MAIKVRKLVKEESYSANGFTETVQHVIMHCGNVDGNANKFYVLEIQHNPTTDEYRLYSEYGRIGHANPARDLREGITFTEAEKEYERIKKSKLRKKTKARSLKDGKEKHEEQYREVDIASPTVGSPNIRGEIKATAIKSKSSIASIGAIFKHMGYQDSVQTLLTYLLAENIHNIQATSNVTVTHNGLETPLGPITHSHIDTARDVLNKLQAINPDSSKARDPGSKVIRELNNEFFSLVPHDHGRLFSASNMLLTDDHINEKLDLLQGMEAALTVTDADDDGDRDALPLSMIEIDRKDDVYKILADKVRSTSKHNDVRGWDVSRIFQANNKNEEARWINPDRNGPEYDLFHGSANANLLSIMMNGFYVPPTSASHVTGRMFGNGVYGASSSSKSFRYSLGMWGGKRNRMNKAYLFIVRFGMGKVYDCHDSLFNGPPRGYHSVHAHAGRTLLNDEFIVYDVRQAKVTHLIEMSQ